jgi:hypothetical protein
MWALSPFAVLIVFKIQMNNKLRYTNIESCTDLMKINVRLGLLFEAQRTLI